MAVTILVLRALGLGDLLTGIPALRGLRRAYPSARIVLATPERLGPLALLSGAVDEILPTERLGALRYNGPQPAIAVNLHGSGPQSITDLLATRPERLITYRNRFHPGVIGPPWRAGQHEVDRWCALLELSGIACNPIEFGIRRPDRKSLGRNAVVIHPGAAAAARRWPPERFADVAAALRREGHPVVITGSESERPLAREVAEMAGLSETSILAGELDILDLVALISDCRLLICGDTGVAHIATATGTPSVLVFGPTPPARWGPRGHGPHVSLWAGNVGDPHADQPHPGLLLITASQVLAASRDLLKVPA